MRIKVLCCSGGIGPGLRTTALLVNDETLVDAGTGVGDLSLSRMRRIRRVLLTHAHLDHVCGLAFMADNLFGLIDRPLDVFALDELDAHVDERIARLVALPPLALAEIKRGLNGSFESELPQALAQEAAAQASLARTEDFAEAMRAFLEKRPARFRGR